MKRYFYISDDLDEFRALQEKLEQRGVSKAQIHVISNSDDEVEKHNLNQVYSWFKTDVMHAAYVGVVFGVLFAAICLAIAYWMGLQDYIGWAPFLFLALVMIGFSTWEAGFIGTQIPNRIFRRFQSVLDNGNHIMQVDCTPSEEHIMQDVVSQHLERIRSAGSERTSDQWAIIGSKKFRQFVKWAP